ncbi:hypothetical protein ACQCLI_32130 (plasmid) [Pseudomonas nitroreducens]|uniref:hypothetical protein n=1 Tax=Pseudomonas nitroreducens TaxID=46680 RepID=UPI000369568C|nr:hypothetical protein [Pseudomonas nitroreducens]
MPYIRVKTAITSEADFLSFIRNSPRHGTVVALCSGAIGVIQNRLHSAVRRRDQSAQRKLHTQLEVLRSEMHVRVEIRTDRSLALGVLLHSGADVLAEVHALQRQRYLTEFSKLRTDILSAVGSIRCQFWEAGVYGHDFPTWANQRDHTDTQLLQAIQVAKLRAYDAVVAMNREIETTGKGKRSWELKTTWEQQRSEVKLLSELQFRSALYKCIRDRLGAEYMVDLECWVSEYTRIPFLRKLRDKAISSNPKLQLQLRPTRRPIQHQSPQAYSTA